MEEIEMCDANFGESPLWQQRFVKIIDFLISPLAALMSIAV
jgi:hypothetical protein